MKQVMTILSVILCVVSLSTPMPVSAADETAVLQVISVNTHGKNAAWLEAYKPLRSLLASLNAKSRSRVQESLFAGTGAGTLNILVESPSMAYMEERRMKNEGNKAIEKLLPPLIEVGATIEWRGLLFDRAPDQARHEDNPVHVVYTIDTNGNTAAFLEATRKIDARFMALNKQSDVRVYEAAFAGEAAGLVYVVVSFPDLASVDRANQEIADDAELGRLFAEREKIGATVVSTNLSTDVTP